MWVKLYSCHSSSFRLEFWMPHLEVQWKAFKEEFKAGPFHIGCQFTRSYFLVLFWQFWFLDLSWYQAISVISSNTFFTGHFVLRIPGIFAPFQYTSASFGGNFPIPTLKSFHRMLNPDTTHTIPLEFQKLRFSNFLLQPMVVKWFNLAQLEASFQDCECRESEDRTQKVFDKV